MQVRRCEGFPKAPARSQRATSTSSITENLPEPRHRRALPRKDKQAELRKATQDGKRWLSHSNAGDQTAAKAWGLFFFYIKKTQNPKQTIFE